MASDPGLVLGAVALGGAISLGTTYAMARRGEKAAAHATARLLRDDLRAGYAMTVIAIGDDQWWTEDFSLPTRSWHEERAPLALFLSDSEWRTVARAFEEMEVTNAAVRDLYVGLAPLTGRWHHQPLSSESARKRLEMTRDAATSAMLILSRFNRPTTLRRLWTKLPPGPPS